MALNELSQKELEKRIKDALAGGQSITKVSDGEGLFLVVRKSGGMSWQLDYTLRGVRKTFSMGTYPKVKLSTARTLAEAARELVQLGKDPVEERRKERDSNKIAKSVAEVITEWLEHNRHEWSARHYTDYDQAAKANIFVSHGSKRITEFTESDIRAILQKVEDRGANYMLTRVRDIMVRGCQYALDKRYIATSPAATVRRREYKAHVEKHFAALTSPREFRELLLRLDREPGSVSVVALRLQCLVWVRPQNLRSARWEHFNLDGALWEVPHYLMKKGREYLVPLSSQAVALLRNWQTVTGHEELLFPGTSADGMLSENTLNANLKRMGFAGRQTAHGFRATARTLLEEGGYESKVTRKQLAHDIDDKTDRAYNRAEYLDVRAEMMQGWAEYLESLRADAYQPWQWFADWRAARSKHLLRSEATMTSAQLSLGLETSPGK
jgi:integrase